MSIVGRETPRLALKLTTLAIVSPLLFSGCADRLSGPGNVALQESDSAAVADAAIPGTPVVALAPDPTPYRLIFTFAGTGNSGTSPDGTPPLQTNFSFPQDITFGPDGRPYLVDFSNQLVRRIDSGVVETVVGTGQLGNAPDTLAIACSLAYPTNVSFDPQGRLLLSAWRNAKVMRMDMQTGLIASICGNGNGTFSGDGGLAIDAEVDLPVCTAVTSNGDIYLTDQGNVRIRKIDSVTGIITTYCGTGRPGGYSGDGGPADQAMINLPWGQSAPPVGRIAIANGYLYLADSVNSVIRRVDLSTNIITTVAGIAGVFAFSGDGGPATEAALNIPTDVDVDSRGNLYICDEANNCIRRVDSSGTIRTIVGQGGGPYGFGGDGGPATLALLYHPYGICFDGSDNLYIADSGNNRFRVVYK